ncbi:MAG: hypothetical protein WBD22_05860 [Pyrinomonadaceae bacterium]
MKRIPILITAGIILFYSGAVFSQSNKRPASAEASQAIRSSAAYAEILVRRTALEADLESLLVDYTDDYPKVKDIRIELELIRKETSRLFAVKVSEAGKLTSALGRLIVSKVVLQADLSRLLEQFKEDHPDAKRARKKVEIYESAIQEILG